MRLLPAVSAMAAALAACGPATADQNPGDPAYGEYLAGECATCHGGGGDQATDIPVIRGLDYDHIVTALEEFRDRTRDNAVMQTVAARLGDEEIASLAAYYSRLEPR